MTDDKEKIFDEDKLSLFEKKMKDLESKYSDGEITEEEAELLLEEVAKELGSTMEEILTALMGAVMEGMNEVMGSMFGSIWSEQVPSEEEVLAMAKKYYEAHKELISKEEEKELSGLVGMVVFDGLLYDETRVDDLCDKVASLGSVSDFAVAVAAAAVGWGSSYPRSADALARVLDEALFIEDEERTADAEKLARYAIYIDPVRPDFYVTLANILLKKEDYDGALDAVNEALGYLPEHEASLKLKEKILKLKD
jgi:tetratricopeptide (TPR) repeat protein